MNINKAITSTSDDHIIFSLIYVKERPIQPTTWAKLFCNDRLIYFGIGDSFGFGFS